MASDAIMAMVPPLLTQVLGLVPAEQAGSDPIASGRFYETLPGAQPPIALAGPFLGAPQAVMAMEKMIALGVRRFWVLGWCGSLRQDLKIGDLLVPTEAISEEGTSRHYPVEGNDPRSTGSLNALIEKTLEKKGMHFKTGAVWTTDAPYRETPSKVRAYGGMGVLAVDMEMSALMTVSSFRGVSLAGLLVVSDELFDLKWRPGFSSEALKRASSVAAGTLVEVIRAYETGSGRLEHVAEPDH